MNCEETFLCLGLNSKLSSMYVHSATWSCSVELYKQWYTLAEFLPNCNFRGVFFEYYYFAVRISEAAMDDGHYIF